MTDTDRTIHGEDEIDLNDDDDDFDTSSSPSGMNDIHPPSDPASPIGSETNFGNHVDKQSQNIDSTPKLSNNGTNSSPSEPTEPYHKQQESNAKPAVS